MGLKGRILALSLLIGLFFSTICGVILWNGNGVVQDGLTMAKDNFPKVVHLGKMLAKFRTVRINVRSLPFEGNTPEVRQKLIRRSLKAADEFNQEMKLFTSFSFDQKGQSYNNLIESKWKDFLRFGGRVFELYKNPTPENLKKAEYEIRVNCPIMAAFVAEPMEEFLAYQETRLGVVRDALVQKKSKILYIAVFGLIAAFLIALCVGYFSSKKLSGSILDLVGQVVGSVSRVTTVGQSIEEVSFDLKKTSEKTASSLEQTVTSIDEISSMI